jgi:Spy/CpxP family protein refolding chaperone
MNTWKVVCATLVIFLAGILTGATLFRIAQGGPRPWRMQSRPAVENRVPAPQPTQPQHPNPAGPAQSPNAAPQSPGLLSREFVQLLERRLQLSPEQRERIGKIMAEGQERVRELRTRIDPEVRKEMQQAREQIRAVLTPEQREQFEQLMKRTQRRNDRGDAVGQPERRPRDQREPQPPPPPAQ